MLVLTRKLMEKLFIGDDICVTVVRLEGGQVRLGIDAPRDITVVRAELVPERQSGSPRGSHGQHHHSTNAAATPNGPAAAGPNVPRPDGVVRIPTESHGTGNRRRGPSR